jgi:hypothetical protein
MPTFAPPFSKSHSRLPRLVPRPARTTFTAPSATSSALTSISSPLNTSADWNPISAPASTENAPLL